MTEETKLKISKFHLGKIVSDETKLNMSKAQKGRIVSAETRDKISKTVKKRHAEGIYKDNSIKCKQTNDKKRKQGIKLGRKVGYIMSEQQKIDISNTHKGKILSEETKNKMSKYWKEYYEKNEHHLKGHVSWNTGLTKETNTVLNEMSIKRKEKFRSGEFINGFKDKKHTDETRKKISIGVNKAYDEGRIIVRPICKDTKPELEVECILKDNIIDYKKQWFINSGKGVKFYDFYLPDYNLLIEVDGVYWHNKEIEYDELSKRGKACRDNDLFKNELAQDKGYNLIRIWQDEINNFQDIIDNIFPKMYYTQVA